MTLVLLHGIAQDSAPLADLVQSLEPGLECVAVEPSADLLKTLAARPAAILLLGERGWKGDLATLIRAIRVTRGCADILITVVLGSSATAEKLEAVEAGVDDLLASPIEPVDFVVRMHRLLETRRLRQAASAAQSESARLRDAFTHIPGFAMFQDIERRIVAVSAESARLLGRTPQEMVGGLPETFLHPRDAAVRQTFERDILASGHVMPARAEELIDVGGAPHLCWIARAPVRDTGGRIVGLVSCALPRSDDGEDEAADVDKLTQLPTRRAAELRLDQLLATAAGDEARIVALVVSVGDIEDVSRRFGRVVADRARLALARRLQSELRHLDPQWQFVARLADDAFINLRTGSNFGAMEVDRELLRARLAEPYLVAGEEVALQVAITPLRRGDEDRTAREFLDRADQATGAMARPAAALAAEAAPKSRIQAPHAGETGARAAALSQDGVERASLADMLERRELGVRYQARIDLAHGHVAGMEARLFRSLPQGWVDAGDWIAGASTEEEVAGISDWLIREISQHARDIFAGALGEATFGLRVTEKQAAGERARLGLSTALKFLGPLAPRFDMLVGVADAALLRDDLAALVAAGGSWTLDVGGQDPRAALDKVGAGPRRLSISLRSAFATEAALRDVTRMAHSRGWTVVGADVDSADDLARLKRAGAQYGQGPFLHKPCPARELVALARSGQL